MRMVVSTFSGDEMQTWVMTIGCPTCACFPSGSMPESTTTRFGNCAQKCAACGKNCGKPSLLDLFSGAGGAARGYQQAGFCVLGVDVKPQPRYAGCQFHQADAMTYPLEGFDAIHASPPCQSYSRATPHRTRERHPDLVAPVRARLVGQPSPWVIENVELAPLQSWSVVCGSGFGLPIKRHRWFESNRMLMGAPCNHQGLPKTIPIFRHGVWYLSRFVNIYGTGGGEARDKWPAAMGIDWMTNAELTEAIPPAYTHHIGKQLMASLGG